MTPEEAKDKYRPIFDLTSDNWYYGSISMPLVGGDLLGFLWRPKTGPEHAEWHFRIRFRWYRDDKAFDSKDVKTVYNVKLPAIEGGVELTPDYVAKRVREPLIQFAAIAGPETPTWLRGSEDGDHEKLVEVFTKRPEAHSRKVSISPASEPINRNPADTAS